MAAYDPKNDLYTILGVADDATQADIKQRYRDKSKLVHPDGHRQPELARREQQRVNDAQAVLGDPNKRREYDGARLAFRLEQLRPMVERRAEELARARPAAPAPPTAKAPPTVQSRVQAKAAGVQARAASVAKKQKAAQDKSKGIVQSITDPHVERLMKQNKPGEALAWGIGSILLDAMLASSKNTKRR